MSMSSRTTPLCARGPRVPVRGRRGARAGRAVAGGLGRRAHLGADPRAVGERPLELCPGRELPAGVNPAVLSFGDGEHKCPGQPLAMLESEVLLRRLLALRPRITREPELGWDHLIEGYWLRGLELSFDEPRSGVAAAEAP